MLKFAEIVLMLLVAIHAAIHVAPMLRHAHHRIHRFLKLKPGEKCSRKVGFLVIMLMIGAACIACAPTVHYTIGAVLAAEEH